MASNTEEGEPESVPRGAGDRPPRHTEEATTATIDSCEASYQAEVKPAVLLAAQRGSREAFGEIIRTYEPRLRAVAFQVLRETGLVDDVVQDVFLAAYRGLPRFRGDAALGTWLYRITCTTCAQQLRRDRHDGISPPSPLLEDDDAPTGDCGEEVAERDLLRTALATLTAEQRLLVLLVDRDGWGYREVARLQGVPRGTVASRLNAARARLRRALVLDPHPAEEGA